jgi:hypothetical protein
VINPVLIAVYSFAIFKPLQVTFRDDKKLSRFIFVPSAILQLRCWGLIIQLRHEPLSNIWTRLGSLMGNSLAKLHLSRNIHPSFKSAAYRRRDRCLRRAQASSSLELSSIGAFSALSFSVGRVVGRVSRPVRSSRSQSYFCLNRTGLESRPTSSGTSRSARCREPGSAGRSRLWQLLSRIFQTGGDVGVFKFDLFVERQRADFLQALHGFFAHKAKCSSEVVARHLRHRRPELLVEARYFERVAGNEFQHHADVGLRAYENRRDAFHVEAALSERDPADASGPRLEHSSKRVP